jgi:pimeloyl-ACP methyl ester carboxylesterase
MLHRNVQKLDPREQHYWIESPRQGMQLFLRYLPLLTRQAGEVRPVLYVHGATFPSALSIAHRFVPPHEQPVLSRAHFDEWSERYLDSDSDSRNRDPAGMKTPTGPFTDILHAWHGDLAYTPALVQAPVAIIRGEWDGLIGDEDARWLFDAFTTSPIKRDIKISRATHLMHLEAMRYALYRESIAFLAGNHEASMRQLDAKRSQPVQQQTGGPFMSTHQEQKQIPGHVR